MSFYTSLTGLNASTAQLGVTSNNIANVGTTGFKRSRADFGDIFATSPLQKASSVIGQGVSLKQVTQEFSQGNIQFSANSLDIAITGDGFFPLKSADGLQDIYTRNGSFFLDDSFAVVNSAGHSLTAASVDSSGKADLGNLSKLIIPRTTIGDARETSEVELALNLPADAEVVDATFDPSDPSTYSKTTAVTVYDAGGNDYLATIYYVKTQSASPVDPYNKWQTHVYIGEDKLDEFLTQAQEGGEALFVNKYGEVAKESDIPPELVARGVTKLFNLDDLQNPIPSTPATVDGDPLGTTLTTAWKNGLNVFTKVNSLVASLDESPATVGSDVSQQQTLVFKEAQVDGSITVAGKSIAVAAGDTAQEVAAKVKAALDAGAFVQSRPGLSGTDNGVGRTIADNGDGTLTITLRQSDGDFGLINSSDSDATGINWRTQVSVSYVAADPAVTPPVAEVRQQQQLVVTSGSSANGNVTVDGVTIAIDTEKSAADVAQAIYDGLVEAGYNTDATLPAVAVSGSTITFTQPAADGEAALVSVVDGSGVFVANYDLAISVTDNTNDGVRVLDFSGAVGVAGNVTVSGVTINADAGETASEIAAKLYAAMEAAGFPTAAGDQQAGLPHIAVADGQLTLTYLDEADAVTEFGTVGAVTDATIDTSALASRQMATSDKASITREYDNVFQAASSDYRDISFWLNVDSSANPRKVDLSYLYNEQESDTFTGVEIAREMTNAIRKAFGDERTFNLTDFSDGGELFRVRVAAEGQDGETLTIMASESSIAPNPALGQFADLSSVSIDDLIASIQAQINLATDVSGLENFGNVMVGYDPVLQSLTFKTSDTALDIYTSSDPSNALFGLTINEALVSADTGTWGSRSIPNGELGLSKSDQRYGVTVSFDETTQRFSIASGTSGDSGAISILDTSTYAISAGAKELFNFSAQDTAVSAAPNRGIISEPAVLTGSPIGINLNNKFRVDSSNNTFVVTVDNVTGVIQMPAKDNYTTEEFRDTLEGRINALSDAFGRTVNGVTVNVVTDTNGNKRFEFSTGTSGDDSFLKVSGNSIWGLADLGSARGTTSRWLEPGQARDENGFPLYVDRDGLETTDPGDFSEAETQNLWSPIFLDKGEITFDTSGKVISPTTAISLKPTTIGQSGATLQFAIDLSSSTQYSSPFAVLKQDQNGRPEGDLLGVDIGDDGLVSASYSNGTQKSLSKIVLANFASPQGLRQIGDSSFYTTAKSGEAEIGEAGSAGFGTLRAGATERANVDLTQELVDLITAQRNFQANAKAIETSTAMTQAIIQIRA